MIAVGERWSLVVDGLLFAIVTSFAIAAAPSPPRPAKIQLAHDGCAGRGAVTPMPSPTTVGDLDPLHHEADVLYRAKRFGDASALVRDAAHGDVELESLATLYHQLDRAWTIAMKPGTKAVDRFEALDRARKLDLVLGDAFSDELAAATKHVATYAAIAYYLRHDLASTEHALDVAELFGARSETTKLLRTKLAQAHP